MTTQPLIPLPSHDHTRRPSQRPIAQPQPISPRINPLDAAEIDRFATLFSPATPPATPTPVFRDQPPTTRPQQSRNRTPSVDSEFGAFVSVPAAQDPLSFDFPVIEPVALKSRGPAITGNASLHYFDQFTSSAKTASEQNRRVVLDELLEHEDDPLYFLRSQSQPPLSPLLETQPTSTQTSIVAQSPPPIPQTGILIDADIKPPSPPPHKLPVLTTNISSHSPVNIRAPLPPRISAAASPPSAHIPSTSTSLPFSSSTATPPTHATLSRLSSTWVSAFLPSARSRQSTGSSTSTLVNSAPSNVPQSPYMHIAHQTSGITSGTPFSTHPYIPPSGAPGFAGDRTWDKGFSDTLHDEEMSEVKGVLGKGKKIQVLNLVGRREGTAVVLSETIANLIRPHLPALTRLPRTWTLLYSLDQHGISLNTLYSRCEPKLPSTPGATKGALVVVKDARDAIFGVWMGDGLWLERGGYYGSGESFLWRYQRPSSKGDELEEGMLDVYKWTGRNDYVALCEPGFISFGGGDGHYGLYLDASLLDGSSAPCPTFDNPVLCSRVDVGGVGIKKDVSFECVGLEVWGVGP
ncbi:TLD-domain-containing protein [Suillus subaureus]|uniref:Oxidation resistance protein 1 n=1 Tax=Suillus subaureus TaxID=48587 RepID=A0A9P7E2D6_9AGAM|nr:TLD-domain-containing protein [Suillus subaureus]KAG1809182.1 TLD-domain-containing protein [Suillus subaureus]